MKDNQVQLFVTCLVDSLQPQIGEAVVNVLNRAGVWVNFPLDQTCCGQPAFNTGMREQAKAMAKQTLKVLEQNPQPIVIPSGSCASMIIHGYPELFKKDPEWLQRAKKISGFTYEFSSFLVDHIGITHFGAEYPETISYHPSCHLMRELNIDTQPKTLLSKVKNAELVDLPESHVCCGFGGLFSVEHPEISSEMVQTKIKNLGKTQATTLVTCDVGCMINIQGALLKQNKTQKVRHIAEILASRPESQ